MLTDEYNRELDLVSSNVLIDCEKIRKALQSLELSQEGQIILEDIFGLLEFVSPEHLKAMTEERIKNKKQIVCSEEVKSSLNGIFIKTVSLREN